MVARLEGDVKRRATRPVSSRAQRRDLGVGCAKRGGKPFADDSAVANDDSADHGGRRCLTPPLPSEDERATHEFRVARVARTRNELRSIRRSEEHTSELQSPCK